jgi:hypothetical protein
VISLNDRQLKSVMEAAARLPPEKRFLLLERLAASLQLRGRYTDDDVVAATRAALRGLHQHEPAA